ncbi:hypothetical protein [Chryseolinea lacunae]|uniref:DUF4374 domain-containing protein n=1 Tax=Chryseolinea lacunae TaxID=2801331 RepID=A0ABS1KX66_9BACT|nr:hypothetical protein [Chryseolinea lacunae]MBL0743802.1 hypothetical protein [Chryseolinea lacunae]
MLRKLYSLLFTLAGLLIIAGCSEKSNPEYDIQNFTSVFDNNKFDASYFPIDMRETPDGGYIILGGRRLSENSEFAGIYLLKVDKFGQFEKEIDVPKSTGVYPVGKLIEYQTRYYFFCMDEQTLNAQIASVDALLEAVAAKPVQGTLTYPGAVSFIDNNFVLLSYDNSAKQSVISLLNPDGGILASKGYDIGVGADDQIITEKYVIEHYLRTGRQWPFEVGKMANGLYYFNGFFNYTFSLVFSDVQADEPRNVVQGQSDKGGLSAVSYIGANKFAFARFSYGNNYILPNKDVPTGSPSSSDFGGYTLPELVADAPVKILPVTVDNKTALVYASNTRSKQIGLYFYDENSGKFISSRYLGFSNPYEIASLIQTTDGGLAITGTTYLAGRFPRICVFKISKEELAGQINK